jgi:hypothetical protein
MLSACGVDAGCNCGAPVIPTWQRAAEAKAANPTKSNRQIAEDLGISEGTVRNAQKKSGAQPYAPEDDRPTIDKPPRGALWDDQRRSFCRFIPKKSLVGVSGQVLKDRDAIRKPRGRGLVGTTAPASRIFHC